MMNRSTQLLCKRLLVSRSSVRGAVKSHALCSSRAAGTVVPFKLADIGEGIAEVELLKWFVKEGDSISTFDRVCEVQSDKATVEITSRYAGVISKVHHGEGDIVKVGSTLVDITTEGQAVVQNSAPAAPVAPVAPAAAPVKTAPHAHTPISLEEESSLIPFKLADIGEGIAEVELMKWYVKEGDVIRAFDRVCEVQSDKATVEITSRFGGVVARVHSAEGDVVKVGSTLIDIRAEGSVAGSTKPAGVGASQTSSSTSQSGEAHSRVAGVPPVGKYLTTPAVRKIAKENNIDLGLVQATGPKGRIVKEDVLAFLSGKQQPRTSTPSSSSSASNAATKTASSTGVSKAAMKDIERADQRVPIRGIQRLMVKSMTDSLQIPHLTYCEEIVFDRMKQLRESLKTDLGKRGIKLSFMPFIIKAASQALEHYPVLNSSIAEGGKEMIFHSNHNIGIAMDTPKGLIVPVIHQVQLKSILDIAVELGELQDAALKGTLTEAQLSGGTFSISNIGSVGGTYAAPVVVLPQVAIGALGRLQMVPRYVNKRGEPADFESIENGKAVVAPVTIMNVSWSADHRVVEGATIARFSNKFKQYIENPQLMVAEMR